MEKCSTCLEEEEEEEEERQTLFTAKAKSIVFSSVPIKRKGF